MQVHIVTQANCSLYSDELAAMHRGRHKVFVEELGWSDLWSPSGLERDAFDARHEGPPDAGSSSCSRSMSSRGPARGRAIREALRAELWS